jgi:hypothetical protein
MVNSDYKKNSTNYPWPANFPAAAEIADNNKTSGEPKYFIRNKGESEANNPQYSRKYYEQFSDEHQNGGMIY